MRTWFCVMAAVGLTACAPAAGGTTSSASASGGASAGAATPLSTLGAAAALGGAGSCHALDSGDMPDPHCTPGATDPRVTAQDIDSTICRSGYSTSVRPPGSVTEPIKFERMAAYGVSGPASAYELDHLIPLEIGGASTVGNLWPEPLDGPRGAHLKARLEDALHTQVCSGAVLLAVAQLAIATNWEDAYRTFVGSPSLD